MNVITIHTDPKFMYYHNKSDCTLQLIKFKKKSTYNKYEKMHKRKKLLYGGKKGLEMKNIHIRKNTEL